MSLHSNKSIARRLWEEVWNQNQLSVCNEIFDPEYARHEIEWVPIVRKAFPDTQITIEDMIAEDDKVVTRYIFSGTHQGDFWGARLSRPECSRRGEFQLSEAVFCRVWKFERREA